MFLERYRPRYGFLNSMMLSSDMFGSRSTSFLSFCHVGFVQGTYKHGGGKEGDLNESVSVLG